MSHEQTEDQPEEITFETVRDYYLKGEGLIRDQVNFFLFTLLNLSRIAQTEIIAFVRGQPDRPMMWGNLIRVAVDRLASAETRGDQLSMVSLLGQIGPEVHPHLISAFDDAEMHSERHSLLMGLDRILPQLSNTQLESATDLLLKLADDFDTIGRSREDIELLIAYRNQIHRLENETRKQRDQAWALENVKA